MVADVSDNIDEKGTILLDSEQPGATKETSNARPS